MSFSISNINNINPSKIIGIQFSILSPEEIRKASVAHITSRDTYVNNKPVIGGLFDPRMGVLERGLVCPTDGLNYMDTPGYFGHIELARPLYYLQYFNHIIKILRCICFKCSKLLINKNNYKHVLNMNPKDRWDFVFDLANKVKFCGDENEDGCGCEQPKNIRKEGFCAINATWVKKDEEDVLLKLTPEVVLKIFRRISDEDITFMGFSPTFSRPEWMICQVLAVPPPAVRPSVKMDDYQRSEDDISHIIVLIIKTNKMLQEKIQQGAKPNLIEDWTRMLQYYVGCMVNNKIPGTHPVSQRSGRPLKSIQERLNGKTGRVRGNLMGKRVDYSARSVIGADPSLSIRELGVPKKIAMNITYPEVVNDRNKNYLTKLVKNGPNNYPGAKILERKNGQTISLSYLDSDTIELNNGDIVHRHMIDGDAVLFNRQPTLHKMSMMCHIAKIKEHGNTFSMNVADTKPYNADFDGDEMNMHMPQDEEAVAELRYLAAVPHQIISPANNSSIIGIFQDSLLGSYRFTREGINFNSRQAMNLLMGVNKINKNLFNNSTKTISNFQILSQILPPISSTYPNQIYNDEDFKTSNNIIEIINGVMKRGQLDKSVKKLIHYIFNDFGYNQSADFIDNLQAIVTEYMKSSAFSVGIADLIADKDTNDKMTDSIIQKKQMVKDIIDQVKIGVFENNSGKTNEVEFETQVNSILNKARDESGKIGRNSLHKNNRFKVMVDAGSKGSDLNIAQMISCLGQQNVDGKRISYGFEDRTLPHFNKFDDSPEARGFVENSFIQGLNPQELFFHAMGGRVGLIDTAVKSVTWDTPVVLIDNNIPIYTEIGKWIDNQLDNKNNIQHVQHHKDRNLELLNTNNIYIPTTDENGIITWGSVTAITRHDPGDKLYKIKTLGGREVTVTESKSLLVWNPITKKFKEISTPDISIGDALPVTEKLCDPPIIINNIDMSNYLSKKDYIYGTDFHTAIRMMNNEMDNRSKIPSGWWNNNNGVSFTLPYNKKSSLQRTINRSNIDVIKQNYIYVYHAARSNVEIPDSFVLDYDNGLFIGLYLAEGNTHNSNVCITNSNEGIKKFVHKWFSKYNINTIEKTKVNNVGSSTTIYGSSIILSRFLDMFVGSGSSNKFIPNEAFISNISFIKGIISGYFSGDGYISNNSIEASSASKRLIEGINMLCSRLGIFGKVSMSQLKNNNFNTKNILPSYRLSIRAQWASIFASNINLIDTNKNIKLNNGKWTNKHRNFDTYNNCVLDKITDITIIGVEENPKMYDLTIPSTLNFGLANGLQVRDTSSTGYIQRRLIKGMEDLKVEYDMTVRNNMNKIIQFQYGDDSFETTKVEGQKLPITTMSIEDIYAHYQMPDDELEDSIYTTNYTQDTIKRIKKQKEQLLDITYKLINKTLKLRTDIIENVFNFNSDNTVNIPVNFKRIITNIKHQLNIQPNSFVDITPLEAFNVINKCKSTLKNLHYIKFNRLFEAVFDFYMNPKDLLMTHRFNNKGLDILCQYIILSYKKSIVTPGEMVGMIAAQSIGEPTTQLTLNTFHSAGISSKSNVTRGVPRIEEILSLSKEPKNPSVTVYLKKHHQTDIVKAQQIMHILEHTSLKDIVSNISICFDPDNLNTLIEEDKLLIEQFNQFENLFDECSNNIDDDTNKKSKWIIRMQLDKEEMLDKNITMDDINFAIKSSYTDHVECIYNDLNDDKLIFRIRLNEIINKTTSKDSNISSLDQTDHIYMLKNIQENILNNIILKGAKGIKNVIMRKILKTLIKEEGNYKEEDIWVLDTVGSNLLDILSMDDIDYTRTYSNNIIEMYNVLGIEATRQIIYNELAEVLESSYINYHHMALLVDRMTCTKRLVSIFRHGINNDNIGPIAKASFEETPEMFLRAARHAEFDNMKGVSANVMCGQEAQFGTNAFNVVLDIPQMVKLGEKQLSQTNNTDFDNIFNIESKDDLCSINNIKIQHNVTNILSKDLGNDNDYQLDF
jgi:DNA-directed RNA polymerase beta' subunit/intein/homing endonuclease